MSKTEFQWKYAEPLLSGLEQPDYGTPKSWTEWYKQAWGHLSEAGLTKVESPLDLTRIRLRIAALCWLSLDFVAASQRNEYANTFYWSGWIESLVIVPLTALATAIDEQEMRNVLNEHLDSSEVDFDEEEDEGTFALDDELREKLPNKIVAVAAANQRTEIVHALVAGFGGEPQLFLGLYLACQDIELLIDDKESELEHELYGVKEQLEYELNRQNEELDQLKPNKEIERLRSEIESFESTLERESLRAMIIEELTDEAFSVPSAFGYDDDFERMNGFNWCLEGCPIQSWGEEFS